MMVEEESFASGYVSDHGDDIPSRPISFKARVLVGLLTMVNTTLTASPYVRSLIVGEDELIHDEEISAADRAAAPSSARPTPALRAFAQRYSMTCETTERSVAEIAASVLHRAQCGLYTL
jgi:hypothetical protein